MSTGLDLKSIRRIDSVLHEPSRLSIVLALRDQESLSFGELKGLLGMTDGNLSIHLRTLEISSYIETSRSVVTGKARKFCRLSVRGREAFERYVQVLRQLFTNGG